MTNRYLTYEGDSPVEYHAEDPIFVERVSDLGPNGPALLEVLPPKEYGFDVPDAGEDPVVIRPIGPHVTLRFHSCTELESRNLVKSDVQDVLLSSPEEIRLTRAEAEVLAERLLEALRTETPEL